MLVLGHRGVIKESLSQNSIQAFQQAVAASDGFETDACVSKDGEVFLIHEAKYADPAAGVEYSAAEHLDAVSAVALGSRRLEQLTGEAIRDLHLKDGQPIPALREALELVGSQPGKLLNIELKAHNVVEPVLKLVKSCLRGGVIAAEQLLISSFNHFALPLVRQELPEVKIGAIFVAADQPTAKLFPWHHEDPATYTALTPAALQHPVLRQVQPDVFVIPEEILTLQIAAMIGAEYPKAQLAAWVFTEKGAFDLAGLLARLKSFPKGKVAAMIVDDPDAFVKAAQKS
jgi:glycerophosphoryl diester phosphodiesterase